MRVPRDIRENTRFLVIEVGSQVSHLQAFFETASATFATRILDRSGYAYNLKMRIHNSCLSYAKRKRQGRNTEPLSLRAMESIATDLERIAELCRDCIHEMGYLKNRRCLRSRAYQPLFEDIYRGIDLVERLIEDRDIHLALKLGRIEEKLDKGYKRLKRKYTTELKRRKNTEDLISSLFIAHSVEQMGDALLNISEAIISANLGQPINIDRYQSIKASVEQLAEVSSQELVIEPIAETRSGSGISGISTAGTGEDDGYVAIYKDGKKQKLEEERDGVESWHEIYPGLAPKILAYRKRGESASLLIEHLAGLTFEQILLHEPRALLQKTLGQLEQTLMSVWRETLTDKPVAANYMQQLDRRLDDVYRIHPEFRQGESDLCGYGIASFDRLLQRAARFEAGYQAPFSVYIHGDFNVDNIIYDPVEKKISFIDLHRSRYMDYVQDISVFMVSNYRLQVLDPPLRRRIMEVAGECYRFASAFARKKEDESFELRLALGLARSFVTSTRFILDKTLARAMFLRARYLLERLIAADRRRGAQFRIPIEEIFSD